MLPAGFETAISACERLQTEALDSAASGIGLEDLHLCIYGVQIRQ